MLAWVDLVTVIPQFNHVLTLPWSQTQGKIRFPRIFIGPHACNTWLRSVSSSKQVTSLDNLTVLFLLAFRILYLRSRICDDFVNIRKTFGEGFLGNKKMPLVFLILVIWIQMLTWDDVCANRSDEEPSGANAASTHHHPCGFHSLPRLTK